MKFNDVLSNRSSINFTKYSDNSSFFKSKIFKGGCKQSKPDNLNNKSNLYNRKIKNITEDHSRNSLNLNNDENKSNFRTITNDINICNLKINYNIKNYNDKINSHDESDLNIYILKNTALLNASININKNKYKEKLHADKNINRLSLKSKILSRNKDFDIYGIERVNDIKIFGNNSEIVFDSQNEREKNSIHSQSSISLEDLVDNILEYKSHYLEKTKRTDDIIINTDKVNKRLQKVNYVSPHRILEKNLHNQNTMKRSVSYLKLWKEINKFDDFSTKNNSIKFSNTKTFIPSGKKYQEEKLSTEWIEVTKNLDFSEISYPDKENRFSVGLSTVHIFNNEENTTSADTNNTSTKEFNLNISSASQTKKKVSFIEYCPRIHHYDSEKCLGKFNPIVKKKKKVTSILKNSISDKLVALEKLNNLIKECEIDDLKINEKTKSKKNSFISKENASNIKNYKPPINKTKSINKSKINICKKLLHNTSILNEAEPCEKNIKKSDNCKVSFNIK